MSSNLVTLLNAVSAVGAGAATTLSTNERYQGGNHSIEVSGTFVATVELEGRVQASGAWQSFASLSAPGVLNVPGTFESVRGNVTAFTSGSITLDCRYPLLQDLASLINAVQATVNTINTTTGSTGANVATLLARLTNTRATLMDNLVNLDVAISSISALTELQNLVKQLRAEGRHL